MGKCILCSVTAYEMEESTQGMRLFLKSASVQAARPEIKTSALQLLESEPVIVSGPQEKTLDSRCLGFNHQHPN